MASWPCTCADIARPSPIINVVIDVPPTSQVHRQVVRKSIDLDDVVIDPRFELHWVELTKAVLGHERSASGQLVDALLAQHQLSATGIAASVLRVVAVDDAVRVDDPREVHLCDHFDDA